MDEDSFGWVSTDSDTESESKLSKNTMVKLEKHSSDEEIRSTPNLSFNGNVVRKQEKCTPLKGEKEAASRVSAGGNAARNISQELGSAAGSVRSNGSVSDGTRKNRTLLDSFISNNDSLQKNNKSLSYEISEDDEIYLLQCPQSVDIDTLMGLEFLGRDKKKFKIGKMSYECVMSNNDANSRVNLLIPPTKDRADYRLHTFNVESSYVIKERVKHSHEIEVIGEDVSVVPFPDNLKVRHPLFGVGYKPLIKLSQAVKEKFLSPPVKLPKVKKIKVEPEENSVVMELDETPVCQQTPKKKVKVEKIDEEVVSPKKSKKRKLECLEQEESLEPKKKIKRESDIWTKETSIEENLFKTKKKNK